MALTQTRYPASSSANTQWVNRTNVHGNTPSTFTEDRLSKNAASADLIVSNYGFSIPVDAVITDVSYTILKKSPEGGSFAGSCTDSIVNMYVGARRSQYNFADTTTNWNVGLPAGEAIYSAPVASWGGLTPAQANASNFGLFFVAQPESSLSATAHIHTISCTITYTLPEFFMKAWNGSAWGEGSLRRWNGSAWETGLLEQVKTWNGTDWIN